MNQKQIDSEVLWEPSAERIISSGLSRYTAWLKKTRNLRFSDYPSLWTWSVTEPEAFWKSIWDYFSIISDQPPTSVMEGEDVWSTRWFNGAKVNYTEHILRNEPTFRHRAALIHLSETREKRETSWLELGEKVRGFATSLRRLGVNPGDRVAAYIPNIEEAVVALLATTAIGAVWAAAPPEFGVPTVVDRFGQIEPKVLIAVDGYKFNGKIIDRRGDVRLIEDALDTIEHVVRIPYLGLGERHDDETRGHQWANLMRPSDIERDEFEFERVATDHPLWILFSSGTTGLPKPIVHNHIGIILEHLKTGALHTNAGPDSISFFYTTTGWMLFNTVVSTLLHGATAVLYDGSPAYPNIGKIWNIAETSSATITGASPGLVEAMAKRNYSPKDEHDLSCLKTILSSGAPASPETFRWLYDNVKSDVQIASISGGTELCGALVGGNPWEPVRAGRIQCRQLGMAVESWSEQGKTMVGEPGELVVTKPFPSMPLRFWNDHDNERYRQAYFEQFPGVWCHGDMVTVFEDGSCYIHGRSDSTLNRHGVRIGTAEIYRTLDQLAIVADSLVVCAPGIAGQNTMYLFVVCKDDEILGTDEKGALKAELCSRNSPRHVPDVVVQAPAVPYTLTGKRMEVPVQKLLCGEDVSRVASRGSASNPQSLDWYIAFAATERQLPDL